MRSSLRAELASDERIHELLLLPSGELLIVGSKGVYRDSGAGAVLGVPFDSKESHSRVHAVPDNSGRFVGQRVPSGEIYVYSASGEVQGRVPVGGEGTFRLAELKAGEGMQVLFRPRGGKQLQVWTLDRQLLTTFGTDHYLTAFGAEDLDGDESGRGEYLLYEYPVAGRAGAFQVLNARGDAICSWQSPAVVGDFDVLPWPSTKGQAGSKAILTNPGDFFLVTTMCGEPLARLEAANAGWFRSLKASWIDDRWVGILASGSGYRPYFLLAIFDADGAMVFRETGEGRAAAIQALPDGFLVAVENQVRRYEIR